MPVVVIVVTKKCSLDSYTTHAIYTIGIARIFSGRYIERPLCLLFFLACFADSMLLEWNKCALAVFPDLQ
jgi:hypothetical protein